MPLPLLEDAKIRGDVKNKDRIIILSGLSKSSGGKKEDCGQKGKKSIIGRGVRKDILTRWRGGKSSRGDSVLQGLRGTVR